MNSGPFTPPTPSTVAPPREVVLQIGEFFFGGGRTKIRTLLGSCVSITMWHPRLKIGGMCHYLLPRRGTTEAAINAPEGNYAEGAMQLFMKELQNTRTQPDEYVVKLFGGGCMFIDSTETSKAFTETATVRNDAREVSARNVVAGRELLNKHGFKIAAEHVGGYGSRVLVFELWSGDVWIRRGNALASGAVA